MHFVAYHVAFEQAIAATLTLFVSHLLCVGILMYLDLSGRWKQYSLHPQRSVTRTDYYSGIRSFVADLILLFIPSMTICFTYQADAIENCQDSLPVAFGKLIAGYVSGKAWATAVHYLLHLPSLYKFHRRHHCNPRKIVASAAWEDSFVEYTVMELPSFAMSVLVFPTYLYVHLLHFCFHGIDGAAGHSGFKAPGLLGYLFDGEYHYYHHAHLTVNYAELEILDKLLGTHHSQKKKGMKHHSQ